MSTRRRVGLSRYLGNIVDDTRDFLDDVLDLVNEVEHDLRDTDDHDRRDRRRAPGRDRRRWPTPTRRGGRWRISLIGMG